ncbi:MAG: transposase [Clostridiales bacterium]|nr:transposase [Clostridiales bacterium]
MPRTARRKSENGLYHVMLRGINQQQIFHDNEDNEKFLAVLKECKKVSEFELHAYCLMGNHVHLLLRTGKEELEQIFKRIGVRYVYWYNWKYKRTGHLFQDRYKSEPVENDEYYFTVLRYIHQNPIRRESANH